MNRISTEFHRGHINDRVCQFDWGNEKYLSRVFQFHAARQGDYLLGELRRLHHPAIVDVRGKGLFVGVEIDPVFAGARLVCEALMQEGVLTKDTHGTVIRLAPALTIERDQIDLAIAALRRALDRVARMQPLAA